MILFKNQGMEKEVEGMLQNADVFKNQGATSSSRGSLYSVLQQCLQKKDLLHARHLKSVMKKMGLTTMAFWGDHLIRLFASCGSLSEANQAFHEIVNPNVYAWNAIISAHAQFGEAESALDLYARMQQQRIEPDKVTFLSTLKACGKIGAIQQGRTIHRRVVETHSDMVIGAALIDMYAKCKSLEEAYEVFNKSTHKSMELWSSMISAHVQLGYGLSALELFSKMLQAKVSPNRVTFLCVLKACAQLGSLEEGRSIHNFIIRNSLEVDKSIRNLLVDFYVKSGSLADAHCVFNELLTQDVVSWSTLIGGYAQQGQEVMALELFEKSLLLGQTPNRVTFLSVLRACSSIGALSEGRFVHDQICRSGMEADVLLASCLVNMYAKCGILQESQSLLYNLPSGTVAPWNSILSGYIQNGHTPYALEMLHNMGRQGLKPNKVTFLCILKACQSLETLMLGRMIHNETIRSNIISDAAIGNALVDMYSKCGSLKEAEQVFSTLTVRNVVSWGAMVDGFVRHGQQLSALKYYMRMLDEGILPDEASFSSILRACIATGSVEQGNFIHDQIIRSRLEAGLVIGGALVDMYAKSGFLLEAQNVLDHLPSRSVVSWGALIAGYSYYGHSYLAMQAFQNMQNEGTQPDEATFVCSLKACTNVGDIRLGMSLHHQLLLVNFDADAQIRTALVDMYAKSACLKEARRVFDSQMKQDAVSWGALIGGYVFCKEFNMANDCLKEMQQQGIRPLDAIYTSVISGCSYAGQVQDGRHYFQCMTRDYGMKLNIEQYTCMVDLLSRTGSLDQANDVLHTMPTVPDTTAWTSVLTGCKLYGERNIVQQCSVGSQQKSHPLNVERFGMTRGDVTATTGNNSNTERCLVETDSKQHTSMVYSHSNKPENLNMPSKTNTLDKTLLKDQLNPIFCRNCERVALALGLPNSKKTQLGSLCSACHNPVKSTLNVDRIRNAERIAHL